jgi:hypothetical protein
MTERLRAFDPDNDDALRYERAALEYVEAYDRDDFEALAELWQAAESDGQLERLLCELNDGLLHESGVQVEEPAREKVLQLLQSTMPSAFAAAEDGSIAVADVAAAIATDRVTFLRLSTADREANAALMALRTPVPAKLDGPALLAFKTELPVAATNHYWRAFQQAALLLRLSRGGGGRAAARQARPPRSPRADQERS